jgi:aspartyl/glutamyl-tRNA(Asn/Gln) amidotransferase C subunit
MATLMDAATLKKIAEICRLRLEEKESKEFLSEFEEILANFSRITEIEARGRELYYVRKTSTVPRKDVPEKRAGEAEGIKSQFARSEDDYMLSPRSM